jgi:hypothetical protein
MNNLKKSQMQQIFQNTKRFLSLCLITLLVVTSALTIAPAAARADNVLFKCESDCGNTAGFAVGAISGSIVTLIAQGHVVLAVPEITATTAAIELATVAAAPAMAVAAPILLPAAAIGAVGYGVYQLLDSYNRNQSQPSK